MKRLVRYNGRSYFLNEAEQPTRARRGAGRTCPSFTQDQLDNMIHDAYVHAMNVAAEAYDGGFDSSYPSDSDYATNEMNDLEFEGLSEFGLKFLQLIISKCGNTVNNGPVVYAQYDGERIAVPCTLLPAGCGSPDTCIDANAVALAVYYNLYAAATGRKLTVNDTRTLGGFMIGDIDFIETIESMSNVSNYPDDQFGEYIEACWDILYDTENSSLWTN